MPGRVGYPFRMLMLVLTLPFHAFLGVTIMGQTELIGGDWYPSLHATLPWLPDPAADQHLAGGILWALGRPDRDLSSSRCCSRSGCGPRWRGASARTDGWTGSSARSERRPEAPTPSDR